MFYLVMWGVQEVSCQSMEDVMSCLESGTALRRTGSTQMNEHSSRSHSVFTIFIGNLYFFLSFLFFFFSALLISLNLTIIIYLSIVQLYETSILA